MKINLLQMKPLLLPKKMIKIMKMNKMMTMIKIKKWAMTKGELNKMNMRMIKKKSRPSPPPHPRVRQIVQRDHPINNILGAIESGVTTRSCIATFFEHYSFISYFEPFKVEDAL
jgi:hypothetical protein